MRHLTNFTCSDWDFSGLCSVCITAAVVGGIGAAGAVGSAMIGSSAAKTAAKEQAQAADKATAASEAMYQQTRTDLLPYQKVGQTAQAQYENLLGIGPQGGGMNAATAALENTPGYQFTRTQGLQAVQSGFAAQGLAGSGPAQKGAAQYAENLAGTTYQSILGDYYGALGLGETAAAQTGVQGTTLTGQANQATTAAGAAQAAGTVGAANATIGGINSAVSGISSALLLPTMFGAMGNQRGIYSNPNAFPEAPTVNYNALV